MRRVLLFAAALLAARVADARLVEYQRPPLTDYQLAAFFNPARMVVIEGTTKTGKNHAGAAWFFETAIKSKTVNHWWVEPVYSQAAIAFRRMERAIPIELRTPHYSDMTLTLADGKVLWFKSGEKPDNLYGEDVGTGIINEASRFRPESWHAIRSTLTATKGPLRIMGNLKGKKNWFYQLARKAEGGAQDMHYARFVSHMAVEAGILDAAEIEGARRDLPDAVFRELYLGEVSEDGSNPFGVEAIRARIAPISSKPPVAFGVDLAKSVDWTAVIGLDEDGACCAFDRFQAPWTETIERVRATVGRVPAYVDSTGVGDPVLEALQRGKTGRYEGYKFSAESKQRLMEGLAVAIQRGEISYPAGLIPTELESYEYVYTRTGVHYEAAEGSHDDTVCALALAHARRIGDAGKQRWRPVV